ncbi:hypothetical protein [Rhizobium sp.]|jgi:hypothetical protein|uniref:hypothetical protein n=1 Tax=Rhizobium sp. TaxID=391 RepID=UPI000E8F3EB5|nr:hypothetical protein [Rhizobium sp.]
MKTIFLASAFALASLSSNIAYAQMSSDMVRPDDHRGPPRHHMHRAPPKRCITEKKVRWDHGKRIVIEKRVCR